MAYDEALAERIRDLLASEADCTEGGMFGGRAFLAGGHMAVCASAQGGILVRVDRDDTERVIATTKAQPMEMRGREIRGWVRVDAEDIHTKRQLEPWVRRGWTCAAALPPKSPKRTKRG